jgi:acyl-[acyl-carrier-protein]-phospholipid O-acyltransferase / long-chain-fatty-acid--[acyl-carrier-protein] ligase
VHKPLPLPVDEIVKRMSALGVPNLWIPSRNNVLEVPDIPLLGAGKVDLKTVRKWALERFGSSNLRKLRLGVFDRAF